MTQDYYGTKRITAWEQEKDGKPGYAVKYRDGYISWSPKTEFDAAYQPLTAMSYGHALEAMKAGHRVARQGWNGKGMFIFLVPGSAFKVSRPPLLGIYPEGTEISYRPHIDIKNVDGTIAVWVPSITDQMANDWQVAETEPSHA